MTKNGNDGEDAKVAKDCPKEKVDSTKSEKAGDASKGAKPVAEVSAEKESQPIDASSWLAQKRKEEAEAPDAKTPDAAETKKRVAADAKKPAAADAKETDVVDAKKSDAADSRKSPPRDHHAKHEDRAPASKEE